MAVLPTTGEMATEVDARETRHSTAGCFLLRVAAGPDAGKQVTLDAGGAARVEVGTSPACALALSDAKVSRRHAVFTAESGFVRLSDASSSNGTFVNGVRVTGALLYGGELIAIGRDVLQLDAVGPSLRDVESATAFGRLVGASAEMRRNYATWRDIAASGVPVVIEGETGTGKELLAEAMHDESPRRSGPFIVLDCTTVAPTLFESALFGHQRGAFTGADQNREGVFQAADGGTLFIDEIGDLDLSLQPKLLRAIERREVQPVGATRLTKVDVRVVVATRRDLEHEVQAGRFRDDLYYRLAVGRAMLPALRHRTGDIRLLATFFFQQLRGKGAGLPEDVMARFESYGWPGNVRELQNAVARYVACRDLPVAAPGREGGAVDQALGRALRDFVRGAASEVQAYPRVRDAVSDLFEDAYVETLLELHDGNVTRAANAAGVARRYFQRIKARSAR